MWFTHLFLWSLLFGAVVCNAKNSCPKRCKCLGTFVDCSHKMFHSFPEILPSWTENLDLSSNKLGGIVKVNTTNISQLTDLNLHKNHMISFPFFMDKTNITNLNLAHNKIDKWDSIALENLSNLTNLDLNKNRLMSLDDNMFPQDNRLEILNINNNLISNLSENCFDTLGSLKELKISHNKLNYMPKGLFKKLSNLELLDLSKNQITVIEGLLFKDLISLKTILLKHNNIENLTDGSFYGLINLQSLHLEGNSLKKISKGWLYGLNSLIHLNISYNKIDQIVSGWEYCANLEELDLSYNKLYIVEKSSLQNLNNLKKLHLNSNRLAIIEEGSFNNTPQIQHLYLDHNLLAWLIEDAKDPFYGLTNLKKLSLADNKILFINKEAFYGLDNLNELNLLENEVLEIQEEAFKYIPNLINLYLNSSSLVCDCSIAWLKKPDIYENLPFQYITAICGSPEKNKGKNIDDVPLSDFLCFANSPKPVIVFHPESKMVLESQNVTLKCGVNSSSPMKINFVWKKDNHDLELISPHHYSSFEVSGVTQYSILNFYNISMLQSGRYKCVASNNFGIAYSNYSILSIAVFPNFTKVPKDIKVITGYTAKLECAANGFPAPQISWQKDGGNEFPAAQERRMKVISKDDEFLIVDVKSVDMGVYSCTARNNAGMIAANATLTVLVPPWFGSIMFNKQIKVGEEVVLECLCDGFPKPQIKWLKDNIPLTKTSRHYFTAENQLLVITETNTNDSGIYKCEISNSVGNKSQEVEVLIMPLYQSLIHKYAIGMVLVAVITCIIITSIIWVLFIYKAKRPSLNLINNADNKSLSSTNSKDSGTGESTKRSQELIYNECLNECQNLNENLGNGSPEMTLPLLSHATVIIGENSVKYKNPKCSLPVKKAVQLPIEKPLEDCNQTSCSKNSD